MTKRERKEFLSLLVFLHLGIADGEKVDTEGGRKKRKMNHYQVNVVKGAGGKLVAGMEEKPEWYG